MATIRVNKDKHNPYVMINKTALGDSNISFKAKGIFAYLMSKPDDWKCQVTDLQNNSKDGRDSIKAGLRELREHGYLIKRPLRDEKGRIIEWEEILYETPQETAKEIFKEQNKNKKITTNGKHVNGKKTTNVFSVSGKSTSGKHVPLLSTDSNNININNKDTTQSSAGSEENDIKKIIEKKTHLIITPNQHKKLKNWEPSRTIKAIDIFKEKNGEYFALLEKIYKDNRNFAPTFKKGSFNNYEQREYDFDELEKKLLGWQ